MVGIMPASSEHFPWDEALYQQLKADNDAELDGFQREEDEAVEKAGDTEIMAARGKRAEFWARVGDKVGCIVVSKGLRHDPAVPFPGQQRNVSLIPLPSGPRHRRLRGRV
jgi:26S proteasome regulatory subunit N7